MQLVTDVLTVQHHLALFVDDLALLVHDVVVLQHLFTDGKVGGFQLLLGALDGVGNELVLDGHILFQAQAVHQVLHALTAEDAHQVIFQAEEEARSTGVALTAGTAAQLVVDTAALVALGTDDEQAAGLAHSSSFALDFRLKLFAQLLKALAGMQYGGVLGLGVAVALGHQVLQLGVDGLLRRGGQLSTGSLGAGLGVLVLVFQLGQVLGQVAAQLLAQSGLGHVGHVAAQHNIGTTAGHVGGDGHGALLTGLGDDLGFALVLLGVQHIMLDALLLQQLGESLALFDTDGADQNGLALGVAFGHLLDDGVVLAVDGLVHAVRQVLAGAGLVGGDADDVQAVDLAELVSLGGSRTGHTGQLVIHTEVVLEGDGGQGLALGSNGHAFLGLDGLVQAVVEAAAIHQTAGELVNDDDLALFDDVVDVTVHNAAGFDGAVNVVAQGHIVGVGQVLHMEEGFGLLHAGFGQSSGLALFVHDIIAVDLLLSGYLVVQFHDNALLQCLGKVVGALVHHAGVLALAADDQRGTSFVDEDGVHLVDDGVGVAALHHVGLVNDHVIAQVIKPELIVGAVGDISSVGGLTVVGLNAVHHQADGQAQEAVDFAHPLTIAASQVIVDGDNMHAFAGQGVEVNGHGGHQGLAFTGLHLSDAGAVQHNAADDLHGVGLHAQHTPVSLTADGKSFGQQVVQRFAFFQARLELGRLGLQLLVGQLLHLRLQGQDLVLQRVDALQFLVREGTKQFFKKRHYKIPCIFRRPGQGSYIALTYLTIIHPHRACCQTCAGVFTNIFSF